MNVVDPYHFVLFQHGVLGYAGDFDNVIEDVLIDHQLALRESSLLSRESGGATQTVSCSYHDVQVRRAASQQAQSQGTPATDTSVRHTSGLTSPASPAVMPVSGVSALPLSATALQERRQAARQTFTLKPEYRGSGRVHKAGNLTLFAPGTNNFLRTNAGVDACTTRLMAEFLPVFQEWLSEVESSEAERYRRHMQRCASVETPTPMTTDGGETCDAAQSHTRRRQWSSSSGTDRDVRSWTDSMRSATAAESVEPYAPTPVCFSCVGHSFGGIILREFLFRLLTNEADEGTDHTTFQEILALREHMRRINITFENFTTLASPHCGVSECLWWPLKLGAYCLDKMRIFPTYGELLTTDTARQLRSRLVDRRHLLALRVFRRRTLFANTQRDLLVGFGAASLIFEDVDDDHTKARGFRRPRDVFCASAFETDECEVSAPIYLPRYCARDLRLIDDSDDAELGERQTVPPHALTTKDGVDVGDNTQPHSTAASTQRAAGSLSAPEGEAYHLAWKAGRDAEADREENKTFPPQYPAPSQVSPLMPHHTYNDLIDALTRPSSPAAPALVTTTVHGAVEPGASANTESPQLSPIASPPPPDVEPPLQQSHSLNFTFYCPPEVPTPDEFVIRTVVHEHRQWKAERDAKSTQQQQQQRGGFMSRHLRWRWGATGGGDDAPRDATAEAMDALDDYARAESFSTVSSDDGRGYGGRRSSSLPFAERTFPSLGELALLTSAGPRPLISRLTAWLLDVPVNLFGSVWRRVRGQADTTSAISSKEARSDEDVASYSSVDGSAAPAKDPTASTVPHRPHRTSSRRDASIVFEERAKQLPTFVEMPRCIAYRLRKHLDWRVRAIRYNKRIPIAHVACLGNWAWAGQSPEIVQAIAEEVLRIL